MQEPSAAQLKAAYEAANQVTMPFRRAMIAFDSQPQFGWLQLS